MNVSRTDYRMLQRSAMTAALWDRNHYWSEMVLRIEVAARLGDNRKPLRLHKTIITRGTINEMGRNSNGVPVKNIKDRLKWDSLRPNLTTIHHLFFRRISDIIDKFVEP